MFDKQNDKKKTTAQKQLKYNLSGEAWVIQAKT
jgi:hypothetical protein